MNDRRESMVVGGLAFHEQDEFGQTTGRSATFEGGEIQPLRYEDLEKINLDGPILIPLRVTGARVVESNYPDLPIATEGTVNAPLESHYASKAIGLVRGGWLPSGLALREGMTVLPDRCTIKDLAARYRDGVKRFSGDDFLDIFQGKAVRINPGLFAMEGNERDIPTPERVLDQWAEAKRKLLDALPDVQIVPDAAVQGVIGLVSDMRSSFDRQVEFLCLVAPKLQAPVSASRRPEAWHWVLETAQKCGLTRGSLVVLAALSMVVVVKGPSPAKRLIKPSAKYSKADAYNALADLRALELLMRLYAAFPDEKVMLCTGDKNLALFWAGIRASGFIREGMITRYTLSPVQALFQKATPDLMEAYFAAEMKEH